MCASCAEVDKMNRVFFPPLPGFDLCEVGQEEVVLKTGKQASRRIMHFALQSLLALFGENETLISALKILLFPRGRRHSGTIDSDLLLVSVWALHAPHQTLASRLSPTVKS